MRKQFGKGSHNKMGPLMLLDDSGNSLGTAKATDLVDGAKLMCTYTYAPGNMGNLLKGGSRVEGLALGAGVVSGGEWYGSSRSSGSGGASGEANRPVMSVVLLFNCRVW